MANLVINKENLKKFFELIEIKFKNLELLAEALTHRSLSNEIKANGKIAKHNERLEFMGDAVLELVTTEYLYHKYPDKPEGELTSFRAALVRTESLAFEARKIMLGEYLQMSYGEESTGGRDREYILANAFEALIGAIYIEHDYATCQKFIHNHVCYKIEDIVNNRLDIDPKSKLQELAQDVLRFTPTYHLKKASGPDHNKVFEMEVYIGEKPFAVGTGKSKQEGEQKAAQKTLEQWDKLLKQNYPDKLL